MANCCFSFWLESSRRSNIMKESVFFKKNSAVDFSIRNQGCTPMASHTFPVLYHASAQPRHWHSKNIEGGLERVLRQNNNKGTWVSLWKLYTHANIHSAKQQQGYLSFTVKVIHTCKHTYINAYIHKWTSCMALNFFR